MSFDDEDCWDDLDRDLDAEADAADELAVYLRLDPDADLASQPEPTTPTSPRASSPSASSTEPPPTLPATASDGAPPATSTSPPPAPLPIAGTDDEPAPKRIRLHSKSTPASSSSAPAHISTPHVCWRDCLKPHYPL